MAIPIFQPQDHPTRTNFNARIEAANAALEEKQDKLTGTQGQVVGFNAAGKPVAQGTESLVGPPGAPGAPGTDGKSAYEYAVDGGYTGTEEEFQALMGSGPWLPITGGIVTGPFSVKGKLTLVGSGDVFDILYPAAVGSFMWLTLQGDSITLRDRNDNEKPMPVNGIATPEQPYGAANKKYVDDAINAAITGAIEGAY